MIPTGRLQDILDRFAFVEAKMNVAGDPAEIAKLGREYAGLRAVVGTIRAWQMAEAELRALADEEIERLEGELPALEEAVRIALLPRDAADDRPVILEIRPGTGGDETFRNHGLYVGCRPVCLDRI